MIYGIKEVKKHNIKLTKTEAKNYQSEKKNYIRRTKNKTTFKINKLETIKKN